VRFPDGREPTLALSDVREANLAHDWTTPARPAKRR
jgi:hypothetical protein